MKKIIRLLIYSLFFFMCIVNIYAKPYVIKEPFPKMDLGTGMETCSEIVGNNGIRIISSSINIVRILSPIVAIVNCMLILLPAITANDAMALKKSTSKCVTIGAVLLLVEIFPILVKLIGTIFNYDLTCL